MSLAQAVKPLVRSLLRLAFRVKVCGIEHLEQKPDGPLLVIAPHVSYLDGMLLWAFVPGYVRFAINTHQAAAWWIKPVARLTGLFPLDPMNPMAMKGFIAELQAGHTMGIFPEGRISRTGGLMKVYAGTAVAADKAKAWVVPIRLDGSQYHVSSGLQGKLRTRWWPRIQMTVLAPRRLDLPEALKGKPRRRAATRIFSDMLSDLVTETSHRNQTLADALIEARYLHGRATPVLEDLERRPWSYDTLITKSMALGELIAQDTTEGQYVGLMLPNTNGTIASIMGMQLFGRIPAMMNFSAGGETLKVCCETAQLDCVYTSRRFIRKGELQQRVDALEQVVEVRYLEDLRERVTPGLKLRALWRSKTSRVPVQRQADDPAMLLFTSGSEGLPKGVVLSHQNLLSNRAQISARIDCRRSDVVFNTLPVFHSFGLTAGVLLPLLVGARTFLYPTPLHYKIIPELVYETGATVLFGSNTFLNGYARHADEYDFYNLRYVVAGAEKLQTSTRQTWMDRFGIRILEGYGTTETAPVLSVNTRLASRIGSVGRFLPKVEYRLLPVDGIAEGGRLVVKGPNIMLGYLRPTAPGQLETTRCDALRDIGITDTEGWYDTGDIARVDEDGFLYLLDRAKRFAKIGGEMVSLGGAERLASACWPEAHHAAVALPDARKGEQVVLLTTHADPQRSELLEQARNSGMAELFVPSRLIEVDDIPVLGTGKTDYSTARQQAEHHLTQTDSLWAPPPPHPVR